MPLALIPLITALVPVVTAVVKKVAGTDRLTDEAQASVHTLLPLLVGVGSSVVACKAACTPEACGVGLAQWGHCVLVGLAAGAGGSYIRDFDKNVLGIASGLARIFGAKE